MLAVIPARGGSKGIPGKNIKPLNGKALIGYTIEAALLAKGIDRVVVTTDDEKIAKTAQKFGAEIPFLRQPSLAADTSSAIDVYLDVAERLDGPYREEPFMVLLPTVPFRTSRQIDEAIAVFKRKQARTLVSVKEAGTPASWYLGVDEAGMLSSRKYGLTDGIVKNRQTNEPDYIPNGAIYILDYRLLKEERTYYCDRTVPYIMDRRSSVDIDTPDDFAYAQFLAKTEFLK